MNKDTHMLPENDEISLGQMIRNLWSTRYTVIACVSIFAALFGSHLFNQAVWPKMLTYSQVINFTFNGAQERKYDNGEPFRLEDILAPAVIAQVHARHQLDSYGYNLNRFSQALSITPYAPDLELIIKQFSPKEDKTMRVKNPAMLADEKAARAQLERELNLASSKSARISLIDRRGKLPAELARAVIADIPAVWANIAIEQRGVTRPPVSLYTPSYLEQAVGKEENIENLQVLWMYLKAFQQQVTSLLKRFPSTRTIIDDQSGLSALDISMLLQDAEKTLVRIPEDWSAKPEFKIGLNEPLFSSRLFDSKLVQEMDYLVILDILSQRIQLISKSLTGLDKYPYSVLVTDPVSGLGLSDLGRLLSDLDKYELRPIRAQVLQLGVSKDRDAVPLYFEFRINELQRKVNALKARSAVVQAAEARYVQGSAPISAAGRSDADGTVARFSEGFLDRIMALNTKGDDLAYRQELNRRSIEIEEQAVTINEEIRELQEYHQMLTRRQEQPQDGKQTIKPSAKQQILQRFETFVPNALERLQEYAEVTQRISDRLFAAREIHALFAESKFAPDTPGQYLKRTSELHTNFVQLLGNVVLYTQAVHKVVDKIHKDKVTETGELYSLASNASVKGNQVITRRNALIFILGATLVGFFAMLGHLLYRSVRRS